MRTASQIVVLLLGLLAFELSCTPRVNRPRLATGDRNPETWTEDTEGVAKGNLPLELVPNAGSKMRFMNGQALTVVYGRVFKPDDWGYAHCAKDKPKDYDGCHVIFNAEERPSMGFFDLYSQRMDRGVQNVALPENLTLNYMRSLRAALGRECDRLVANEESGKASSPLLVKAGGPTKESLDLFFRRLLDVEGTSIDLEVPFDDYVKAYKAAVAMDPNKEKATHNAYTNLCLTLAMDPQVFIY